MSGIKKWMRRAGLVLLGVAAVLVVAGAAGWWWLDRTILSDLPEDLSSLRGFRPPTACEVLDADGQVIDTFYLERRFLVDLDDLPDHVWQAFVAAEDQHFFEHPGVDVIGIVRAALRNLRSDDKQGGSTLTQQLVKNLLLTPERSYERKIKEAVLAWRLERGLSKQEILELYLNYVYLGSGNYGIEAASRDYFGISSRGLDPGEAALLAGLVPAPSLYSPRRNPERARFRRSLVLRRMVDEGYVDAVDAISYEDAPVLRPQPNGTASGHGADAYITVVRRELRRLLGRQASEGGFRVRTPFDAGLQEQVLGAVDAAMADHLARQGPRVVVARTGEVPPQPEAQIPCFRVRVPRDRRLEALETAAGTWKLIPADRDRPVHDERDAKPAPLRGQLRGGEILSVCRTESAGEVTLQTEPWAQAAAVVVENATGRILALTGGRGTGLEGFVRATQAQRQPGSSFKPYVYATAIASGRTQVDIVHDAPIFLPAGGGKTWSPKNYGGGYAGALPLRRALALSLNTVAVRLALDVGPSEIVRVARGLGVRTPLRSDLTVALGSSEVTPMDQAMAYSSLARLGVPMEPVFVDVLEDVGGTEISRAGSGVLPGRPGPRALDAGVAYVTLDMMREVVRAGTARRAWVEGYDRAGKTGTTNDNVDAWFVGTTPLYTVAVWVGTDGTGSLGDKETGGRAALPAWKAIIEALPDQEGLMFPVPDDAVRIPTELGLLAFPRGRVPERILPVSKAGTAPLPLLP